MLNLTPVAASDTVRADPHLPTPHSPKGHPMSTPTTDHIVSVYGIVGDTATPVVLLRQNTPIHAHVGDYEVVNSGYGLDPDGDLVVIGGKPVGYPAKLIGIDGRRQARFDIDWSRPHQFERVEVF
ncbi:hypothetical protein GCM10009724_16820 [Microbacterium lacticum]|uniref:hypothetical protein n=2 Tax=Microbacterium lacticum TaxID=33885 RepID=UPI00114DF56A|nr:hypothetical protein [Microbacterium lacticum]GEB95186.1 hypothetical protein MLA01_14050 [Microbacterium lacticum]GGN23134.1 hypothetical protein GCM10009724_16820 [Microbacterium lacticum]